MACVPCRALFHPHPAHMDKMSLLKKNPPVICCFHSPSVCESREICGLIQGETKPLGSMLCCEKLSPLGSLSVAKGKTSPACQTGKCGGTIIPPFSLLSSLSDNGKGRGVRIISLKAVFFAAPIGPPDDLPSSVQPKTKKV